MISTGAEFSRSSPLMNRPVALSAATGSISSSLLWLLKDWATQGSEWNPPLDLPCVCNQLDQLPFNFWVGLGCGFLLWPLLELVVLGKQWLSLVLKSKIASLSGGVRLYKVVA